MDERTVTLLGRPTFYFPREIVKDSLSLILDGSLEKTQWTRLMKVSVHGPGKLNRVTYLPTE